MTIKFDLNDLQAFRAVAESGSFRRAAETIRITQPALSRRIDKLESALNVKLFERTTRKVSLTTVGQAFMPQVERMLDDLDLALLRIGDPGASQAGTVTVACVPSAAYYFMSQAINALHQVFPKIRVRLFDGSASHVSAAVASGEADFGVSFSGNLAPEVEFESLFQERYVIACRRDHPLAQQAQVSWKDAYAYDYLTLDKTSGNRLVLDRALSSFTPERPSICETRHVTTLIGLVEAGVGIAAVPSIAMPSHAHPVLASVPLIEPEVVRDVGLLTRRGRTLTPAALELAKGVRQMAAPSR
ncbi:LysR family transcriptional regulator [Xanthomonas maliensis]|uniref:LysR family transcriptional regulator n=1 Tax=Xanthomonas maliensis TaxID=1321368 RepID=UPI0003A890EF|nr:LysR family transcriptional regulator [Xanthomonas maliensis]KAB7765039.1 LysR family transcriptional regulator [Xanthomonas maliensis]